MKVRKAPITLKEMHRIVDALPKEYKNTIFNARIRI